MDSVVPVLGWHVPAGESLFPKDPREQEDLIPETGERTRFPYILVMKRGRQSLDIAMRSRRFAGHDLDFCRRVARNLAQSLQRLHEQDIIHCDVKPRNVLLAGDDAEVMLCDLDASARKGSTRTVGAQCARFSSSYCSQSTQTDIHITVTTACRQDSELGL